MQKQGLPYLWSGAVAEMSKSRALVTSGWQHWIWNLIIQESLNVEFMEPGNLGNMGSRNENSQNQNLCCPKCRQGLGFIWGHWSQTEKRTNKCVFAYFPSWPRGPSHTGWSHMLVSFDETCFAGNDSSIVDHALSVVRNHTNHAKAYGSALRVFSKSMNWSLWIWWLLRCAIRETEWAHKVNCTYCIPEGNYRVHTAFPKPDLSGLWVWTPN